MGQVLKVIAAKTHAGSARVLLDSGHDDASNFLYKVEIYDCYSPQPPSMGSTARAGLASTLTG